MLDSKKIIDKFTKYIENLDIKSSLKKKKLKDTYEILEITTHLLKKLELNEEEINLALVIAIFYDISTITLNNIDNKLEIGLLSVKKLFIEGLIRYFIETEQYDEIICQVIMNHDKEIWPIDLNPEVILQLQILNDSINIKRIKNFISKHLDKKPSSIDISFNKSSISNEVYDKFINQVKILKTDVKTPLDEVVFLCNFLFTYHFKVSLLYIKNDLDIIFQKINPYEDIEKEKLFNIKKVINSHFAEVVNNNLDISFITLRSDEALNLLISGYINNRADFKLDKNKFIKHSIYVGIAASRIALALNLDSDKMLALGYIHDIGRKIAHNNHPLLGYQLLHNLGYLKEARFSLTHSFLDNDITLTAGGGPKKKELYNLINTYLKANPKTIYDNIIQLCDLFCLETGFTTIEKRMLDITRRKGVYDNSLNHFKKVLELKVRIEELLGQSLYSLFQEINEEDLEKVESDRMELLKILTNKKI